MEDGFCEVFVYGSIDERSPDITVTTRKLLIKAVVGFHPTPVPLQSVVSGANIQNKAAKGGKRGKHLVVGYLGGAALIPHYGDLKLLKSWTLVSHLPE